MDGGWRGVVRRQAKVGKKERKKELLLGGVEVEKMQLQLYTLRSSSSLVFPFLRGMVLA
jgi:hypothetical protein